MSLTMILNMALGAIAAPVHTIGSSTIHHAPIATSAVVVIITHSIVVR